LMLPGYDLATVRASPGHRSIAHISQ